MKQMRYDDKVKAAILTAVQDARRSGKTWAQALDAATQVGYKGTVGGLTQMVMKSKADKKKDAPVTETTVPKAEPEKPTPAKAKAKKTKPKTKPVAAPVKTAAAPAAPIKAKRGRKLGSKNRVAAAPKVNATKAPAGTLSETTKKYVLEALKTRIAELERAVKELGG